MACRRRSRRLATIALAGWVLCATLTAAASPGPSATHQGWSTSFPLPTFVSRDHHIYVAAVAGVEHARAFVELSAGDSGTSWEDLELVLIEGSDGLMPEQATLAACPLAEPLTSNGRQSQAPALDCQQRVVAERTPTGEWRVPLELFAARWSSGGGPVGLGIFPDISSPTGTWRVDLDGTRTSFAIRPVSTEGGNASAQPGEHPSVSGATGSSGTATTGVQPRIVPQPTATPATAVPSATSAKNANPPTVVAAVSASHPAALLVIALACGAALVAAMFLRKTTSITGRALSPKVPSSGLAASGVVGALALGATLGNADLYRFGLVLIVIIAAIGLHILVNWAGELSLAHATFIGAPAFVVAKVSTEHQVSPIYLLPLGVATGAMLGLFVGLPALRAKGLQVALVTLAAAVAIDRFFFTKPWFVGPLIGYDIPPPSFGPVELTSVQSLYRALAICFLIALIAARVLWRSKISRALFWVRSDPQAAAAFGIPVATYRLAAYTIAGAFAGFAGGLTVVWVQRLTPGSFPLQLSFTYLIIVVLAGAGFVGGIAVAAAMLEGGRLYISETSALVAYGGPISLILVLTRFRAGLNGIGRRIMKTIKARLPHADSQSTRDESTSIRWDFLVGSVAIGVGFIAIAVAWYHVGNTDQLWIQNQELISGGVGGLALVLLGGSLLIRDQLAKGQDRLAGTIAELISHAPPSAKSEEIAIVDPVVSELEVAGPAHINGPGRAASRPLRSPR